MRRILLVLDTPTEEGETEIVLLSDLRGICPLRICRLYRDRWTIERHFSLVKTVLHGEIEGLGRPRAALFAMGMALVAANALAVVKQALRVTHGQEEFEKLSGYYLADEVAGNYRAVDKLVAAAEWAALRAQPAEGFWEWCRGVASWVRTRGLHKHPRGPKKPQPPRASGKDRGLSQNRPPPGVDGGQFPSERVQSWASSPDWPRRSEFPCPRSRNASPVPSPSYSVDTAMSPGWLRTVSNRGNRSTARPMTSLTPWTGPPLSPASTNSSGN
jgi:hypothetical protein